ncbi:MAG: protease modulator HflC [Desulfobacteraceae bacterium]|nr:protease modulator HflC [Desulfobacteraceae bacterium]
MKPKAMIAVVVVAALGVLAFSSAYVVDETEQVVVTQFGKVVRNPIQAPGLYFRIPFIQQTTYFPKNLLHWDGDPGQIPTKDKTYIWVDTFARWKIIDPVMFFQTVNNTISAKGRLDDIIDAAVRNFITSYSLIETVRNSNRKLDTFEYGVEQDDANQDKRTAYSVSVGRERITEGILKQAQPKLSPFGIELVDVKIKRINYVEEVRESVYGRMIAERKQIAEKFRSQGKGEAQKILGNKEKELKKITSEAYRTAQEIKGKAEARATRIYADAYSIDPEFYSFIQTLDVYKSSIGEKDHLILTTDSAFLRFLKDYEGKVVNP